MKAKIIYVALSALIAISCQTTAKSKDEIFKGVPDLNVDDDALGEAFYYSGDPLIPASGTPVLRDTQTGSLWNLRGEAFLGTMADEHRRLRQVPALTSFWFAWSVFNADTDVWTASGIEEHQSGGVIQEGTGCGVPCNEIIGGGPPKDGIPSLDFDRFLDDLVMVNATDSGANYMSDSDRVLGTAIWSDEGNLQARAYSHNLLWWHEIANDSVGVGSSAKRFTVSYCPLTGSGLVFPSGDKNMSFGTSGKLYNSNLVMYDRVTDSQWSQMLRVAITGSERGAVLPILAVLDTTWGEWKRLHPTTLITSDNTGADRDYDRYPYGDYFTNDNDTFRPTRPDYDRGYGAKTLTLGIRSGNSARAFPYDELRDLGDEAVINDTLGELELALVWLADSQTAIPFDRVSGDIQFEFELVEAP